MLIGSCAIRRDDWNAAGTEVLWKSDDHWWWSRFCELRVHLCIRFLLWTIHCLKLTWNWPRRQWRLCQLKSISVIANESNRSCDQIFYAMLCLLARSMNNPCQRLFLIRLNSVWDFFEQLHSSSTNFCTVKGEVTYLSGCCLQVLNKAASEFKVCF